MRRRWSFILLILIPVVSWGQAPADVSGPGLGYVFDSDAHALRPIIGIIGSARIGAALDLGFSISLVVSLPDQHRVIAATNGDLGVCVVDLTSVPAVSRRIAGADASVSEISLSPHARAAVLSYPAEQILRVITELPDNPSVAFKVPTDSIPGPFLKAVVNDDASALAMSFSEDGREAIYRWNPSEGYRSLVSLHRIGAMTFVSNVDLVFADSESDAVVMAHDVHRQSTTKWIAGPRDGISRPVGIGISNRNEMYIANAGSGTVMTLDSGGRILRTEKCGCKIFGLYPLATGLFRLTERLNSTNYLLDSWGTQSRITFLPPLQ